MSDGDNDADKTQGRINEIPPSKCTFAEGPKEFRVLAETEEYYVIQLSNGQPSAVEKERVRVVTISGYIT